MKRPINPRLESKYGVIKKKFKEDTQIDYKKSTKLDINSL